MSSAQEDLYRNLIGSASAEEAAAARFELARQLEESGKREEAEQYYREALASDLPSEVRSTAMRLFAHLLATTNRRDEAVEWAERAHSSADPDEQASAAELLGVDRLSGRALCRCRGVLS
jgi:tetratricopeptide (TPR) repeat protein